MAGFDYDDEDLQKYLKKMEVDQSNRQTQGMAAPAAAPNPYHETAPQSGGWTSIVSPLMKVGGMAANLLGQPEIGIPLSIAGGAVGGAGGGGGMGGALKGGLTSAATSAIGAGVGAGLNALTDASAGGEAIITGSKLSAPLSSAIKDPGIMASLGETAPTSIADSSASGLSDSAINQRSNELTMQWMNGAKDLPSSSSTPIGINNLQVSNPLTKLTVPYANMSGMDVMQASGNNGGS